MVNRPLDFGVVIYDLETIHDAERGTYHAKGLYECSASEQIVWKRRSQIIEFAALDVLSGERLRVRCRPDFSWDEVRSYAARCFAEDNGHDHIVKDESLPEFRQAWANEVVPFLRQTAGEGQQVAMIAHNGDSFDHFVLEKELNRLELSDKLPLVLHRFDPIRTLKQNFGQYYGCGGQLALRLLHAQFVGTHVQDNAPQHEALTDCIMLQEVLSSWHELSAFLAVDILSELFTGSTEEASTALTALTMYLACPEASETPNLRWQPLETTCGNRRMLPQGRAYGSLNCNAAEFVPGAPWVESQSYQCCLGPNSCGCQAMEVQYQ